MAYSGDAWGVAIEYKYDNGRRAMMVLVLVMMISFSIPNVGNSIVKVNRLPVIARLEERDSPADLQRG